MRVDVRLGASVSTDIDAVLARRDDYCRRPAALGENDCRLDHEDRDDEARCRLALPRDVRGGDRGSVSGEPYAAPGIAGPSRRPNTLPSGSVNQAARAGPTWAMKFVVLGVSYSANGTPRDRRSAMMPSRSVTSKWATV